MKVVIQCVGKKKPCAGCSKDKTGAKVCFVAQPNLWHQKPPNIHACRPDDPADPGGETWRQVLVRYNNRYQRDGANPDNLLAAGALYNYAVYRQLVRAFGWVNVYILSAGWGLVRSDFLLPDYNITFSKPKKKKKQTELPLWVWRRLDQSDHEWHDFNFLRMPNLSQEEPIHFFGGKSYLDMFYRLSATFPNQKVIHHKGHWQDRQGYESCPYTGPAKTNWQNLAAEDFIRTQVENSQ